MIYLKLKRIAKKAKYTIGKLYINDQYFCDTIEDKDRGLKHEMSLDQISKIKVKNETAIPSGTYKVTTKVVSPKFKNRVWAKPWKGIVPRILNVPGFDGVLIHPGTDQNSTSGCIIVGQNKIVGKVINSQATYASLMCKLINQDKIYIEIV